MDDCGSCGALLFALHSKKGYIAKLLVDHGADIRVSSCEKHETFGLDPAHFAAWLGDDTLLASILSRGYDCTSPVHPIHIAISCRNRRCIEVILIHTSQQLRNCQATVPIHAIGESPLNPCQKSDEPAIVLAESFNGPYDYKVLIEPESWPWELFNDEIGAGPQKYSTALHHAVCEQFESVVQLLLQYGAFMNVTDIEGSTPLHLAASQESMPILRLLISDSVDQSSINVTDKELETPLFRACCQPELFPVTQLLLDFEADIHAQNSEERTPLFEAIASESQESCKALIAKGARIDIADKNLSTPLHEACDQNDLMPIIELMLERNANVHARDQIGQTPLFRAVRSNNLCYCQALIDRGAKLDETDTCRRNVLHNSIEYVDVGMLDWLLAQDPSLIHQRNIYGCSPINHALRSDEKKINELVIDGWTDFSLTCPEYHGNVLHEASLFAKWAIFERIIKQSSKADLKQGIERSSKLVPPVLTHTVQAGRINFVKTILDTGLADVDIHTEYWESPLYWACKYGRLEIVKLLLQYGAQTSYTRHDGRQIDILEVVGPHDKVRLLLRTINHHGAPEEVDIMQEAI